MISANHYLSISLFISSNWSIQIDLRTYILLFSGHQMLLDLLEECHSFEESGCRWWMNSVGCACSQLGSIIFSCRAGDSCSKAVVYYDDIFTFWSYCPILLILIWILRSIPFQNGSYCNIFCWFGCNCLILDSLASWCLDCPCCVYFAALFAISRCYQLQTISSSNTMHSLADQ